MWYGAVSSCSSSVPVSTADSSAIVSTAATSLASSIGATEPPSVRADGGTGSKEVTAADNSTGIVAVASGDSWMVGVMAGAARQAAETNATRGLPMDECIPSPS
ncbi:hypothetical protein ASG82_11060 [Mycobacterium sp. Soil538]|nr:hypothetical protein ASG82_11060 [Mycobacterium sp. Soil538]